MNLPFAFSNDPESPPRHTVHALPGFWHYDSAPELQGKLLDARTLGSKGKGVRYFIPEQKGLKSLSSDSLK